MTRILRSLLLILAFGAISAALAFRIVALLGPVTEDGGVDAAARGVAAERTAASLRYEPPPIETFDALFLRPLFTPDRRPADEYSAPPAEPPPDDDLDAELKGVVSTDASGLALIAPMGGGAIVRVSEGDDYRGWRLVELGPDSATFRRGDETETLRLRFREDR